MLGRLELKTSLPIWKALRLISLLLAALQAGMLLRYQQYRFNEAALPQYTQDDYTLPRPYKISERDHFEDCKHGFIMTSIEYTWSKLNDYYTKLTESPLFSVAIILHPSYNIQWLEQL